MIKSVAPLRPITTVVGENVIKRYDAKLIKSHNPTNSNINIGFTPKGSLYYREVMPDKSMSTLYLRQQDGTEVIVDSFKEKSGERCNVIVQKDDKVVDGKYVHKFNNKYNAVVDNIRVGYPARAYVSKDTYMAMELLQERIDMSEFRPKKSIFSKIKNTLYNKIEKLVNRIY